MEAILLEFATLGGGCFWCTEAVFLEIEGVKKVVPGYSRWFQVQLAMPKLFRFHMTPR